MVSRSTWINVGDSSLRLLLPMQTMQTLHNHKSLQTFKLVKILREPNLNKSIGVSRVSDNNYIYCMFPLDNQYYRITIGSHQVNRVEIWKKNFVVLYPIYFFYILCYSITDNRIPKGLFKSVYNLLTHAIATILVFDCWHMLLQLF